jgi:hypothetical protein
MTKNALLAVVLVGLVQNSYGFSFKDALKETANAIAEAAKESAKKEGQPPSSTAQSDEPGQPSQSQPVQNAQSQKVVLNGGNAKLNPDDLKNQGMWQDPRTGLIWSRCLVGATWDGSDCTQQGRKQAGSLLEAVYAASEVRVGGFSDWRIPTPEEIDGLRDCSGDQGPGDAKTEYPGNDGGTRRTFAKCKWGGEPKLGTKEAFSLTTSWDKSSWLVSPDPQKQWIVYDGVLQPHDEQPAGYLAIRVVRGGKAPTFYPQLLAQAQTFHAKQVADNKVKQQEAQQAAMARAQAKQQEAAEYERKAKEMQKNVKPGDRIPQGLVLEVKGDLVKVQTYARECATYRAVPNPISGKFDCEVHHVVASGEKWIRRDEIRPIVPVKFE